MFRIFDKLKSAAPAPTGPVEYIIAGLGNPGKQYEMTRHNAGFLAAERLAAEEHARIDRLKFKSLTGDLMLGGRRCLLLKPSTFMNLSGQAVTEAMAFYKIPPERVIVLFDDVSLDVGRIRIRRKGSDGGHNGMKNIIYLSGSDAFLRVKIGVGQKPNPQYDLAKWVLSRFAESERPHLQTALDHTCAAVRLMVGGEIDRAMNLYNG